jgi:hypothetical protein
VYSARTRQLLLLRDVRLRLQHVDLGPGADLHPALVLRELLVAEL